MQTTLEFLDTIKAKQGLTSDYQLAKFLKLSDQRISFYRTGKSRFDEDTCIMVADVLGLDQGYVMACIAAERTKSAKAKAAWKHTAELLGGLAAALAVVAFLPPAIMSALPSMSDHASLALLGFTGLSTSRHCILCKMQAFH